MTAPLALIVAGYGLNCEEETAHAFKTTGARTKIIHINDLIENPQTLDEAQIFCVPGGFSYGDDTGSGNAFAQKIRLTLQDKLTAFIARDTLMLGICNGCQVLVNLGMVPATGGDYGTREVAVTHNRNARYQCRWIDLRIEGNNSPWLKGVETMHIPVAHGEGRFMADNETFARLDQNNQIAARYAKGDAPANGEFPFNPNGSTNDIAGMTDESGRVLVLMPHPERGMFTWQRDDYARLKDQAARNGETLPDEADGLAIFKNAVKYFAR